MIIFLALAGGHSTVTTGSLTLHTRYALHLPLWPVLHGLRLYHLTRTAIWVAEQLTEAKFRVEEIHNGAVIECDGIGYVPSNSATAACS